MSRTIDKLFFDHPSSVDETYFQHARFAATFSIKLFAAAFAALLHALVPALFKSTAGNLVLELGEMIKNR